MSDSQAKALKHGAIIFAAMAVVAAAVPWLGDQARFAEFVGLDFEIYRDATARWFDGDGYYLAHQLAGPYEIEIGDVLYPPVSIVLFAPFTILPEMFWWLIPLGVTGWGLWRTQPAAWAWIVIGLCVTWPVTMHRIVAGNVVIWVMAALSLRGAHPGASVVALVKPTLAPFALFGLADRRWLTGVAVFLVVSVIFAPMWIDWIHVATNARYETGILYSWWEYPMLLIPIVAWMARERTIARADVADRGFGDSTISAS